MGIVQKQSFYSVLSLITGILIGLLCSGYLYPTYFTESQNGELILLNSYSMIISNIAILGFNFVILKFIPGYKSINSKSTLVNLFILFTLINNVIIFLVYFLLHNFSPWFNQEFEFLSNHIWSISALILFTSVYFILDSYTNVVKRSVVGILLKEVIQRSMILILILVFVFATLNYHDFFVIYIVLICFQSALLYFYLVGKGDLKLNVNFAELHKDEFGTMAKVALYSSLFGIMNISITSIDSIMIEKMLGTELTGIYGRSVFFGIVVSLPYKAIHKISSGILSHSFKENDLKNVKDIYYKSVLNQMILGLFILGGVWLNIDNIYHIIPASYAEGKYVILFIGIGNLMTMIGGVNTAVISFSPYYKWNTVFVAILLALVVGSNLIFIPIWGITGAACATAISMFLYNLLMYILLLVKFKFQPFNLKHLLIITIGILCYLGAHSIPIIETSFIVDLILRSAVFASLFGGIIYFTKLSPDLNGMVHSIIKRMLQLLSISR